LISDYYFIFKTRFMKRIYITILFFTCTFLSSKAQNLEGVYSSYISKKMGGFNISQSAELIISKDENNVLRYNVTNTTIDEYNGSVPRIETTEGKLKAINTQQYNFIGGTYGERGAYFRLSLNKPTISINQLVIFFAPQRGNSMIFSKQASLNENSSTTQKNANTYSSETVLINGEYWMTNNLNVSEFNNGDIIQKVNNYQEWKIACDRKEPIWMYYKNNPSNGLKYGKIYNYYALIDKRGLAPDGFHIPSKNEFESLKTNECVKLKSTEDWLVKTYRCKKLQNVTRIDANGFPYLDLDYVETNCQEGEYGNNITGFNAQPSGSINNYGPSDYIGLDVGFWSSTSAPKNEYTQTEAPKYFLKINWNDNFPSVQKAGTTEGYYVRCVFGKSDEELEIEAQIIKKREDSIFNIKIIEEERKRKITDSINKINRRIEDSLNAIRQKEIDRRNQILARERDSILEIQYRLNAILEKKRAIKTNCRLNYWGFGMSANNISKNQSLLNNNAWKFVTDSIHGANGKVVNGSTTGFNFIFSAYLTNYVGLEFQVSSYRDGYYKVDTPTQIGVSQGSTEYFSLLRNSFYGAGPIFTIPISNCNLDFKCICAYSRGFVRNPNISPVPKYRASTFGGIFGAGIRIPIGKGELLENGTFSRGYIGLHYEAYLFNYKYSFGSLPAFNNSFALRYINTIN